LPKDHSHIRLIVSDLDHTLLRRDSTISDNAKEVLGKCREAGMLLAFATSRSERQSERFIAELHPDILITNSGAQASFHSTTIHIQPIEMRIANFLLQALLSTGPKVGFITANTVDEYLINREIDPNAPQWKDYAHGKTFDPHDGFSSDVLKIAAEIFDEDVASDISLLFPHVHTLRFTGENWYQFSDLKANKANALIAVSQHLKIPNEDIVAFGDDINDRELLLAAGIGVAVSNAIPEVKEVANFICGDCDEDGVARWLETHCFPALS
jgi:Cof subfamily protein (haloacid dehalogenase superfamily)